MTARSDRRVLTVRVSEAGIAELDRLAAREGVDRSEMIRTLLAEAVQARQARKQTSPR